MASYDGVLLPDIDDLDIQVSARPVRPANIIGMNLSDEDYPPSGGGAPTPKTTGQIWPRGNW